MTLVLYNDNKWIFTGFEFAHQQMLEKLNLIWWHKVKNQSKVIFYFFFGGGGYLIISLFYQSIQKLMTHFTQSNKLTVAPVK